jgi:uncharacterized protein YkwD
MIMQSFDQEHTTFINFTTTTTFLATSQSAEDQTATTSSSSSSPTSSASIATYSTLEIVTVTVQKPPPEPSPEDISGDSSENYQTYASPILYQHNLHRWNHSVPRMVWNETLAGWAKELAEKCNYTHSHKEGDGQYGQNIGAGWLPKDVSAMITDAMYNDQLIW